jgi:hypothetical protein
MYYTEDANLIPVPAEYDYGGELHEGEAVPAPPAAAPRSKRLWIPFLLPLGMCGISYLCGGVQLLSDMGFLSLSIICAVLLVLELLAFPQRMGIGGILLFGGVLIWFCYDYLITWFGVDPNSLPMGDVTDVLGKQTFMYCVFVMFMAIGLGVPPWRGFERRLASIPEPPSTGMYFIVFLIMASIGISSFLFSEDSLPSTLMKVAFSPWLHETARMTVSRTGNYNTNWGGYVAQLMDIGVMSAIVGAMYAVFVARDWFTRIIAWTVWLFWVLQAYGGGRRGQVAFVVMPALAFLYLRFQMRVLAFGRKHSIVGYLVVGALGLLLLFVIQIQGKFRDIGLGDEVNISKVDMTVLEGNRMFSEALPGFRVVPEQVQFFGNRIPGEGAIRALPETLFWFVMGPIPRALWNGKPDDPALIWYNRLVAGTNGKDGTTISQGLVGHWYFRYGLAGVIEGGMLVGWLMGVSERLLQAADGRPMTILAALAFASWLFRIYRNFYFIELYGPLIGIAVFIIVVRLLRPFSGGADTREIRDDSYG